MKKNFVKYFGVASTTLLAVAPVATPALMTASNLAVVKAGVQDDITAAFKADNSLVQLSADQWKGLTSTIVNEQPESGNGVAASQDYLNYLRRAANTAKTETADLVKTVVLQAAKDFVDDSGNAGALVNGKFTYDGITAGNYLENQIKTTSISLVTFGDGRHKDSIAKLKDANSGFEAWSGQFVNPSDVDPDGKRYSLENMFSQISSSSAAASTRVSPQELAQYAYDYFIDSVPDWWFVSKDTVNDPFAAMKQGNNRYHGKKDLFTAVADAPESTNNGLVTVAPRGGVRLGRDNDYTSTAPELAYVGDNLVDLQKRTDNELLNLVPSVNKGENKSGTPFTKVQGHFNRSGGTVVADGSVSDGSKVWTTILQAVLNPKDAMFSLFDSTSANIVNTKMLVNGKDATKNQFITKDEIQNAERISIQFVFKTNDGNEYKSPTIWLSHGAKFTVNTTGLANITRLPGDFYQPSAGITGTFNDTGLPMDSKKFVVVPAGTDLSYYTDKDGMINLTDLAALQGGILGTNGVAVDRGSKTAFEGGKLDPTQYWTNPNYIYSKFGSYNDAVDIYYMDGNSTPGKNNSLVTTKTKAESKSEAASAVKAKLNSELAKYTDTSTHIEMENIWKLVADTVESYITVPDTISSGKVEDYLKTTPVYWNLKFGSKSGAYVFIRENTPPTVTSPTPPTYLTAGFLKDNNATYPVRNPRISSGDAAFTGTVDNLFSYLIEQLPTKDFKEKTSNVPTQDSKYLIPAYQLNKVVANAARTTKVDVPSKYLPQVSFNNYKGATYYGNGATINNWFNYDWNSGSTSGSGNNPYYPSGGVIVTGGTSAASSSAAKQPTSYLAPAAFAANSISAEQLQDRVTDNIQKFMTAKLSNPNTQSDSNVNGYFKGYDGASKGDAAYAYIKNGAVPASDVKVDTSKVDVTKPGTYYVEVTYSPLNTIKRNTFDGNLGSTNGNVAITDANGHLFKKGEISSSMFNDFNDEGATVASSNTDATTTSDKLTTFAADQIFANGAPATYKLPVQITDGSNAPQSGAPVIAFTEGGQNLKIAKGGTFDQFKGLQFYAYPGAKAWDQKDDSVKVEVSGKVNTNVEGTYTLVYTVTNKAGKSSTLTRVITVGDGVEKPTEYEFNLSQAYIDYVPGYNVREYGYPGDEWTGKQIKHGTSVSVTKRAVFQNGEEWYKLGDGNWVKKQYVKAGQNPNEAVEARGVVTVNYVPGYGIAVYKEPGKSALVQVNGKAKRLAHGTSWKSFKKQTVNNVTYYNVGGNQWVNGNFVIFK